MATTFLDHKYSWISWSVAPRQARTLSRPLASWSSVKPGWWAIFVPIRILSATMV